MIDFIILVQYFSFVILLFQGLCFKLVNTNGYGADLSKVLQKQHISHCLLAEHVIIKAIKAQVCLCFLVGHYFIVSRPLIYSHYCFTLMYISMA